MASKENVQVMFKAMDYDKQQKLAFEQAYGSKFANEYNIFGVEVLDIQNKAKVQMLERINEFAEKMYEELFTDKEVNEMIQIYSSPVFKRLLAMSPEIMQRIMNYIEESSDEFMNELERIHNEMTKKMVEKKEKKSKKKSKLNCFYKTTTPFKELERGYYFI